MSNVLLKVDGVIYAGWEKARIGLSLESIANTFELTLTDKWSKNTEVRPIKVGSSCEIWSDDNKIITGYIDDVYPEYDATQHSVVINGRSKAGDLVDCAHAGKQFKNRNLKQLADELCKPFNINVLVANGVDVGKAFKNIEIETGETIFEFLEQAARIRALRFVSNIDGDIVITQSSKERISTSLTLGGNILSASGEFSLRDRFSEITVTGSKDSDDDGWGVSSALIQGKNSDPFLNAIKRHRPTVITADGAVTLEDCKERSQWEVNTRYGRSQTIVYTVNDWQHKTGIWFPNYLITVHDDFMGVNKEQLLVETQLILDEKGERTEIHVMPPEAFELVKLPEPNAEDIGWGVV